MLVVFSKQRCQNLKRSVSWRQIWSSGKWLHVTLKYFGNLRNLDCDYLCRFLYEYCHEITVSVLSCKMVALLTVSKLYCCSIDICFCKSLFDRYLAESVQCCIACVAMHYIETLITTIVRFSLWKCFLCNELESLCKIQGKDLLSYFLVPAMHTSLMVVFHMDFDHPLHFV